MAAHAAASAPPPSVASWIPEDDVVLKNAVEAGASLEALAKGAVRFSRKFTVRELRDRWHSLLYDAEISAEASARMAEFEISANFGPKLNGKASGVSREIVQNSMKRKIESVRRLYYAMRKRVRVCSSQDFGTLDIGFLSEPDFNECVEENVQFDDDQFGFVRKECYDDLRVEIPCFEREDGFGEVQSCVKAEENKRSRGIIDSSCSFRVGGILSPGPRVPLWETIEDVSAPEMLVGASVGDKGRGGEETLMQIDDGESDKLGLSGSMLQGRDAVVDVLNNFTPIPESDFVDLSDSLLNFAGESEHTFVDVEGEDMIDKSCQDSVNLHLMSSPKGVHDDTSDVGEQKTLVSETSLRAFADECPVKSEVVAVGSLAGDGDQCGHSSLEINPPSSTLAPNNWSYERSGGEMECVLNTEDTEIPCNDDIFSATKFSPRMKAASCANQKGGKEELVIAKREDNPAQSHNSSQMVGLDLLQVMNPSPHLVNYRVKCESPGTSPAMVSREVCNVRGDAHQCRSPLAGPISASVGLLKAESLFACNTMSMPFLANASPNAKAVSVPEADHSASDEEESGTESEDDVPSFSDIEAMILEMDLCPDDKDSCSEVLGYQNEDARRTIMRLEQCARSSTQRAIASRGALAVLYGRHLKHYIKGTEVILGRATEDMDVDIDLGREGPANKISRQQALIKMERDGSFFLKNIGKSPLYLNGRELFKGQRMNLGSSSLIEIREMAFVFEMNGKSVRQYLQNVAKIHQKSNIKFEWTEEGVP